MDALVLWGCVWGSNAHIRTYPASRTNPPTPHTPINPQEMFASGESPSEWLPPGLRSKADVLRSLSFCSAGLITSFLIWGILQERMLTMPYRCVGWWLDDGIASPPTATALV